LKNDVSITDEIKSLYNDLKAINLKLWDIEDGKRDCERNKDFGEKFIELARTKSTGPSGPKGGYLGKFQAAQMVPEFSQAASALSPKSYSKTPVKTQFGYHVVKVLNKRPSLGQAEAAHIMIAKKSNNTEQTAEQLINELYRLIEQGESFENLAKQYSDDKSSAVNGGKLKPFKSGEINSELFVDTAFSLDVGAISNPIQTKYGWHIIKLLDKKPIESFEQLKFDLVGQLENLDRDDKVVVVIDSIGNLASKKELEDALNEKSVADMSRAKALKGLFRMVTPYLTMKNIPLLAVNHTYQEIGLFPKAIVSGGTGIYYSADNIWIIGRRQVKKGTNVTGYDFVINVEKSRFVKEKSKVPISVTWEGGIAEYSGLLEVAMAGGYVVKPSMGWYAAVNKDTGEIIDPKVREKDTVTEAFWTPIFETTDFKEFVKSYYSIGHKPMLEIDLESTLQEE